MTIKNQETINVVKVDDYMDRFDDSVAGIKIDIDAAILILANEAINLQDNSP